MITEYDIESYIDSMEETPDGQSDDYHNALDEYLETEIYPNLLKDEAAVLHFCLTVIYGTLKIKNKLREFDLDEFISAEENNWEKRDKDSSFSDSLDQYFTDYEEEDLLAFIEDMIVEDEDQQLSLAGQEIIFITAKSYIDQQLQFKS